MADPANRASLRRPEPIVQPAGVNKHSRSVFFSFSLLNSACAQIWADPDVSFKPQTRILPHRSVKRNFIFKFEAIDNRLSDEIMTV